MNNKNPNTKYPFKKEMFAKQGSFLSAYEVVFKHQDFTEEQHKRAFS